jgi:putative ABC transport system substrate-binding protein
VIERRSAEGRYERLPSLVQELLALHVDVIVASGPAFWAARRATDTIPLVGVSTDDLDKHGSAASLARPGRNVTGLTGDVDVRGARTAKAATAHGRPEASRVALSTQQAERPLLASRYRGAAHALGPTLLEPLTP